MVKVITHGWNISAPADYYIFHGNLLRSRLGIIFLTAVAPAAWGTTYIVTEKFLPPDRPLFAALVRALPIGLVLLAWRRQLPRGDWWWKAIVLAVQHRDASSR